LPHGGHEHNGSLLPLFVISLFFAAYVVAAVMQKQNHRKWSGWRSAGFIAGCVLLAIAFSPQMMDYAHHDFRGHMAQHLLLGMLAPLALVSGAPVTLALHALPQKGARLLSIILGSGFFHFLSHPAAALLLNTGGMYLLYLTPLYNSMHNNAAVHYSVHVHFLAAGYLFTWAMVGPDPAPRRPPLLTRLFVLFLSMAAHSYLSKAMYAYNYPRASVHSEAELQAAAKIMYYGGDVASLLLLISLFVIWYKKKGKPKYTFYMGIK
jgi:putative membrane protein